MIFVQVKNELDRSDHFVNKTIKHIINEDKVAKY